MLLLEYLETHLPIAKANHILSYLEEYKCTLRITKPRKTKRGDFRQNGKSLGISINHDTNSFRFLFTLVHEIAHLKTFLEYRNKVKPHGEEWKENFRELFWEFKIEEEFQKDSSIYKAIMNELINPKACSGVNVSVEKAFARHDQNQGVYLEELSVGETFTFRSQTYRKLENRRTRVMCLNLSNNRKYTINKAALVELGE